MTDPNMQPEPIPAQVIQYATPMMYQPAAGQPMWRENDRLIVPKVVSLPLRCVKCNQEITDSWRWRKTLYRHHPALALLVLFPGLIIYVIVALCVRQKAVGEASLCEEHRSGRNTKIALTWIMTLGSFVVLIGGIMLAANSNDAAYAMIGILLFIVMLIAAIVIGNMARVVSPTKMEGNFAWLKGAGPEYLNNFPATAR
jgi:hypothetical protein